MAFSMISRLRRRTAGSLAPKGYFRWPDRHMLRMGTPIFCIVSRSWARSWAVHSSRARRASVSSMLISTKS